MKQVKKLDSLFWQYKYNCENKRLLYVLHAF